MVDILIKVKVIGLISFNFSLEISGPLGNLDWLHSDTGWGVGVEGDSP